ncbi:hypothetical protein ACFXG3_29100, partial [Nocardia tengchongensis]
MEMRNNLSFDASIENAFDFLQVQPDNSALTRVANSRNRPLHIVLVAPPYFDIPPVGYGGVEAVVAT